MSDNGEEPYDLKVTRDAMRAVGDAIPPIWKTLIDRGLMQLDVDSVRTVDRLIFKIRLKRPDPKIDED